MPSWAIHQITTFATAPFRGNPAFVVVTDGPAALEVLQRVRSQLREPVLSVITRDGDATHVRFLTEQGLHSGPGHSMHAAAWVALNRVNPGRDVLALHVAGMGVMRVARDDDLISVGWSAMECFLTKDEAAVEAAIGLRPLYTLGSSFGTVAILPSEADVVALVPDGDMISALRDPTLMVTAPSTAADFVIRVFAPRLGLPEDPVCGTAHRIIAPYWAQQLGRSNLLSWQASPRGGELYCRVAGDIVTIAGKARPFLEGTIDVDGTP